MEDFSGAQSTAEAALGPVGRSLWRCSKCEHDKAELGESRQSLVAATPLPENEGRYTTVTCERCGFTEFYRAKANFLMALFDFSKG